MLVVQLEEVPHINLLYKILGQVARVAVLLS
jgi:hypothetical protein